MAEDLKRWEYKKISGNDVLNETILNKFGQEGWELVNVPSAGSGIMKRPAKKAPPAWEKFASKYERDY